MGGWNLREWRACLVAAIVCVVCWGGVAWMLWEAAR